MKLSKTASWFILGVSFGWMLGLFQSYIQHERIAIKSSLKANRAHVLNITPYAFEKRCVGCHGNEAEQWRCDACH